MTSNKESAEGFCFAHQEALELELNVLIALLERNRCSHRRTKYFQRLEMAKRQLLGQTTPHIRQWLEASQKEAAQGAKFWDNTKSKSLICTTDLLSSLCESISRIEHASTSLFVEISRGFFLPFCLTAVSCIARIRTVLRLAGKTVLAKNQQPQQGVDADVTRILSSPALGASLYEMPSVDKRVRQVLNSFDMSTLFAASTVKDSKKTDNRDNSVSHENRLLDVVQDAGEVIPVPQERLELLERPNIQMNSVVSKKQANTKRETPKVETKKKKERRSNSAKRKKQNTQPDFFDQLFGV